MSSLKRLCDCVESERLLKKLRDCVESETLLSPLWGIELNASTVF